jgi:hypothetical protein
MQHVFAAACRNKPPVWRYPGARVRTCRSDVDDELLFAVYRPYAREWPG